MAKHPEKSVLDICFPRDPLEMDIIDNEMLFECLVKRDINKLYHFTPVSNLKNIIAYGILPRNELESRQIDFVYTDKIRLDCRTSGICLSVSRPNSRLLCHKIFNTKLPFCIIEIDASVLLNDVVKEFFYTNAASKEFSIFYDYTELLDLHRMFKNKYDNMPNDIQAEIIFYGTIPLVYLKSFYFFRNIDIPKEFLCFKDHIKVDPVMFLNFF